LFLYLRNKYALEIKIVLSFLRRKRALQSLPRWNDKPFLVKKIRFLCNIFFENELTLSLSKPVFIYVNNVLTNSTHNKHHIYHYYE